LEEKNIKYMLLLILLEMKNVSKAILMGFLVDVHCVSESNLEVEVDCSHIDLNEYKELVGELEDLLNTIDEKHSVRGIRVRYRRVSTEERKRRLRFSPFPSKFGTLLKNTRTHIYELMAENCLVLESAGKRKIYLLPKQLAPLFVEAVDRVNMEVIEPLKGEIEDFRQSDDYLKVQQCLYDHKVDSTVLKTSVFPIGNFIIDILPVDFSYSLNADEVYAKMGHVKTTRGLEILKREIEKKQREYALSAVSDLVRRISDMAEALTEPRKKVRSATEKVDKLMVICESLGLNKVNEKVLSPLKKVCRARHYQRPKLAEELFGEKSLKEGVDKELKRLFQFQEGET
jgi:hypothetical protein